MLTLCHTSCLRTPVLVSFIQCRSFLFSTQVPPVVHTSVQARFRTVSPTISHSLQDINFTTLLFAHKDLTPLVLMLVSLFFQISPGSLSFTRYCNTFHIFCAFVLRAFSPPLIHETPSFGVWSWRSFGMDSKAIRKRHSHIVNTPMDAIRHAVSFGLTITFVRICAGQDVKRTTENSILFDKSFSTCNEHLPASIPSVRFVAACRETSGDILARLRVCGLSSST